MYFKNRGRSLVSSANSSAKNDLPDLYCGFVLFLPLENDEGGMLFSYQNRSDFLEIWNCCPRRQANVGPTTAPVKGLSAKPPTKRSMSSTCCCDLSNILLFVPLQTSCLPQLKRNLQNFKLWDSCLFLAGKFKFLSFTKGNFRTINCELCKKSGFVVV